MGEDGANGVRPVLVLMAAYSLAVWIVGTILQAVLLLRARQGRFVSRFPLFFSYVGYTLAGSVVGCSIWWLLASFYPTFYWFYFLTMLLAEFAVLVEISDHIFEPVPAIRRLGRLLVLCLSATFLVLYILPSLIHPRPSGAALLEITLRLSVTKAGIVAVLLIAAEYYRLPIQRDVGGLMLGFGLYHGVYIAALSAAGAFGKTYAQVLWFILPLGFTLCLLVWTIALWRSEPVLANAARIGGRAAPTGEPLSYQLGRFNTVLTRLLLK
jgi:hypothetical protein